MMTFQGRILLYEFSPSWKANSVWPCIRCFIELLKNTAGVRIFGCCLSWGLQWYMYTCISSAWQFWWKIFHACSYMYAPFQSIIWCLSQWWLIYIHVYIYIYNCFLYLCVNWSTLDHTVMTVRMAYFCRIHFLKQQISELETQDKGSYSGSTT